MNCSAALALAVLSATLLPGDKAPDFVARDTNGQRVALADMLPRGPVVLAFFPKPFTPGCSQQMGSLAKGAKKLKARGAQVVAISRSDDAQMGRFRAERGAGFPFVADDGALIKLYQVGADPLPMSRRATFVIAGDGRILRVLKGGEALDLDRLLGALPPAGGASAP